MTGSLPPGEGSKVELGTGRAGQHIINLCHVCEVLTQNIRLLSHLFPCNIQEFIYHSGVLRDKTMDDKLIHFPITINKIALSLGRLKLLVEKFGNY